MKPECTTKRLVKAANYISLLINAEFSNSQPHNITGIELEDGSGYKFNYKVDGGKWNYIDLASKIKHPLFHNS